MLSALEYNIFSFVKDVFFWDVLEFPFSFLFDWILLFVVDLGVLFFCFSQHWGFWSGWSAGDLVRVSVFSFAWSARQMILFLKIITSSPRSFLLWSSIFSIKKKSQHYVAVTVKRWEMGINDKSGNPVILLQGKENLITTF